MKKIVMMFVACVAAVSALYAQDWANYGRYAKANAELERTPSVVFMGNSITAGWVKTHPAFFTDNNYVGRGISGQVTAQMLARFQSDVVNLSPKAVVILAGINDIARNNGTVTVEHIFQNIASMAEIAAANGIKPVLCSVLPASSFGWRPEVTDSAEQVRELNAKIEYLAKSRKWAYVDYHSAMTDEHGGLPKELADDGIHPTPEGYDMMEAIIAPALKKALKK